MSILDLPNELLFYVAKDLDKDDIYSLLLTSRYFTPLTPQFHKFACGSEYCVTALCMAAANRNEYMIRLLLDNAPPMFIQQNPREYPSTLAGITKDEKDAVVKHLLEKGSESIILDGCLRTAIYLAVESRKEVMTKHLLNRGADASSPNYISQGPIYAAITNKDQHMVQLLLQNGANIEGHHNTRLESYYNIPPWREDSVLDLTPLMHASSRGAKDIVIMLVNMGADINAQGLRQWTALFFVIFSTDLPAWERRDMACLLLELGANPNTLDVYGRTVLDTAWPLGETYSVLKTYGATNSPKNTTV